MSMTEAKRLTQKLKPVGLIGMGSLLLTSCKPVADQLTRMNGGDMLKCGLGLAAVAVALGLVYICGDIGTKISEALTRKAGDMGSHYRITTGRYNEGREPDEKDAGKKYRDKWSND